MRLASGAVMLLTLVVSAPAPAIAQLAVRSVSPESVQLAPGGPAVEVTVNGSGLNTVTGVRLLVAGRAIPGVSGVIESRPRMVRGGRSGSLVIGLTADAAARAGTYQLELVAGSRRMSVRGLTVVVMPQRRLPPRSAPPPRLPTINNPVPVASSVVPGTVAEGTGPVTVTVKGSAFADGAVVQWNGSPRPTVRVTATQLTATLSASDVAAARNNTVTVANPAPGGGISGGLDLTVRTAPRIVAFYIGGSSNPDRAWKGEPVSLHVQLSGPAPTHWRSGDWLVDGQPWRPMPIASNHTIPTSGACQDHNLAHYELAIQFATIVGSDTVMSAVGKDVVSAREPWCSPPKVYVANTAHLGAYYDAATEDVVCGPGRIMSGIQAKVISPTNRRITTLGPVCPGEATRMVGSGEGMNMSPGNCNAANKPEPRAVSDGSLQFTSLVCAPNPQWVGAGTYDPLYAKTVSGERAGNGNPWIMRCPFDAVPIGLRIGRDRSSGRAVSIAMICVGPDVR